MKVSGKTNPVLSAVLKERKVDDVAVVEGELRRAGARWNLEASKSEIIGHRGRRALMVGHV